MSKTPIQLMNISGMGQEVLSVREVPERPPGASFGTIARLINDDGRHFEFYIDLSEAMIAKLRESINGHPEDPTGYLLQVQQRKPQVRNHPGHLELIHLKEELLEVLKKLQEERPNRIDWVEFEREQMFLAVNERRILRGKSRETPMDEFLKAERSAVGHSDYSSKFALYCAELVLKE